MLRSASESCARLRVLNPLDADAVDLHACCDLGRVVGLADRHNPRRAVQVVGVAAKEQHRARHRSPRPRPHHFVRRVGRALVGVRDAKHGRADLLRHPVQRHDAFAHVRVVVVLQAVAQAVGKRVHNDQPRSPPRNHLRKLWYVVGQREEAIASVVAVNEHAIKVSARSEQARHYYGHRVVLVGDDLDFAGEPYKAPGRVPRVTMAASIIDNVLLPSPSGP